VFLKAAYLIYTSDQSCFVRPVFMVSGQFWYFDYFKRHISKWTTCWWWSFSVWDHLGTQFQISRY